MRRRGDGVGAEDYGRGKAEMGQGSGGPWWALAGPRRITAGLKTRIESSNQTTATNAAKLAAATASSVASGPATRFARLAGERSGHGFAGSC